MLTKQHCLVPWSSSSEIASIVAGAVEVRRFDYASTFAHIRFYYLHERWFGWASCGGWPVKFYALTPGNEAQEIRKIQKEWPDDGSLDFRVDMERVEKVLGWTPCEHYHVARGLCPQCILDEQGKLMDLFVEIGKAGL